MPNIGGYDEQQKNHSRKPTQAVTHLCEFILPGDATSLSAVADLRSALTAPIFL